MYIFLIIDISIANPSSNHSLPIIYDFRKKTNMHFKRSIKNSFTLILPAREIQSTENFICKTSKKSIGEREGEGRKGGESRGREGREGGGGGERR